MQRQRERLVIFWKISIHKSIKLKNPVTTASGIFGSGREYGELIDLNRLGAITVKGVSEEAWKGNSVPRVAEKFADCDIALLELNISCPNVEEGGLSFGANPHIVERVVGAVRHYAKQPLIVKMSPEVSDITEIAKATVAVGTANFHNPYATVEIIDGIWRYMKENKIFSLEEIRGCID